ncbi:MAG: response regulator [Methylococcaceae bacterium]|nr:response regulator [Methylococcaceae bacterium]
MPQPLSTPNLEFLRTLSVLYVEDEEEVRNAMTHFLSRRFARIDVASNGQEGFALFENGRQDVVITDIKMPVMDGLEMSSMIKSIADDVPVIVVTAYNETDYFLRAIEIGVDRFVKKPVNPSELVEAIQKSTQVHMQQKQLEKASLQLLNTLQTAIGALSRAIEKRDPYTDGHQKRVSQIATAIAEEMKLPKAQINGIRLGAMIHDIGKISIPTELLTMPGKLSRIQFELIQTHPQAGADILEGVEFPWPIAQMVLQHHERLNGSGYPKGLKAEQILLEAKIIAVADVVEAMASHRPYRPALGLDVAIAEVKTQRGVLYDAEVVDGCLKVLERQDLRL